MLFWIFIFLALVAAAVIGTVVFRHWKEIRLLDPSTIRAEQERRTRDFIVNQRFQRRLSAVLVPVQRAGRQFCERVMRSYRQVEERLSHLSASSQPAASDGAGEGSSDLIRRILDEAAAFTREGRWAEAERAYLEILKHNERQLDAYRGLGALYLQQRQFAQAKETYQFLERIHGADDASYAALAEIAEAEGDLTRAEALRERAVEANPKNAARHAELAVYYLAHGSPEFAHAAARRAVDLDPLMPRYLEICLESAILLRDRKEADRCYDRLRLRSDDRAKLQAYREKIDALVVKA